MSLYRTYRPKTLDDIVGQQHVVTLLRQAINQDHLSHAYLLAGTRGTGKTSTARILARHMLTKNITDPILKTQVEKAIDDDNLVDLVEIDAASNTGVANIRDLIEKIQFTPVVASAKVYIIDEVHMLSSGAFNALLKTLEEPPVYAFFILATTELHKIPATIQSRCQRFLFRQISEDAIVGRLRTIAEKEQITAEEDALRAIARAARGGMRDAISLLDQLRTLPTVTAALVTERIGESEHAFVDTVLAALESGERSAILSAVRSLEEAGIPLDIFVRLLLGAIRNQLHDSVRMERGTATQRRRIDVLLQCTRDLRTAPVPGLVLESALLSLAEKNDSTRNEPPPPDPNPQVPSTKKQEPMPNAPSPILQPPVSASAARDTILNPNNELTNQRNNEIAKSISEQTTASPSALSIVDLRRLWPEILKSVQPASARMSLPNGQLHALEGTTLVLRFASNFHREKASAPEGLRSVLSAITAATGQQLNIKTVLDTEIAEPPPEPPAHDVDLASAVSDIF